MSACLAIEDACGVTVPEEIALLRRLLYCGEWIESHTLHVYLLHAPDFLGYPGAIEMAADHPRRRRAGAAAEEGRQRADDAGGRSRRPPGQRQGRRLLPVPDPRRAGRAAPAARAGARRRARHRDPGGRLRLPGLRAGPTSTSRCAPTADYPIEAGSFVTSSGRDFAVGAFGDWVAEEHVEHSHALHARLRDSGPYVVGPARPLLAQPRPAAARGAAGGRRRGAGADVPQPVPLHRRAGRRARGRLRGGAAHHRRLVRRRRPRRCRGAAARRGRVTGRRRRPAGCSTTATSWPRTARSSTRRSCRPTSQNQAEHRGRPARLRAGPAGPRHRGADPSVRAGDPQLRPVHLLRHPLPRPHRGGRVSALVVGIGNPSRGDDAVGPLVADRVARLGLPNVEVVVYDEPLALVEHLAAHDGRGGRGRGDGPARTPGDGARRPGRPHPLAHRLARARAPTGSGSPRRSSWPGPWAGCRSGSRSSAWRGRSSTWGRR